MKRLYSYLIDIFNLCMTYCLCITIPVLIFVFEEQSYDSTLFLSMAVPILLSYLANAFIHKLILFLPVHVFMTILPLFMHLSPIAKFCTFVLVILLWVQDIYLWTNHRSDKRLFNIHGVFVILSVFLYLYSTAKEQAFMSNLCYYAGLLHITCFILRKYLQNLNRIPADEHATDSTGTTEIIHNNNKFVFTIIGLLFIFNVIAHQPYVEVMVANIISWGHKALKWLWSFLWWLPSHLIYGVDYDKRSGSSPEKNIIPDKNYVPTESTFSKFTALSEKVFNTIIYTVLILILVYIIYRILRFFFSKYSTREKPSYLENNSDKPIETVERIKAVKSKKHHHLPLMTSINDKIRQKYAHKINSLQSLDYEIKTSQTPNERATDIQKKLSENVTDLTEYYNKARYSDQKLTNKDWQKVKEYF